MRKNESITQIMSEDVLSVHTKQKLSEVRSLLAEHRIHHVPVTSGSRLVGMLSSTDMMRLNVEAYGTDDRSLNAMLDHQFSIEDVMQTDLVTMTEKQQVRDAAEILANNPFHSIPVVDDSQNLKGIVTSTDLIRYLLEQY